MKKINIVIVTGGAGFIGSHTCLSLLERGYKVIIIDSLINSSRKSIYRIREILEKFKSLLNYDLSFYEGSLVDKKFIEKIFSKVYSNFGNIDAVIHFAGLKSVNESVNYPNLYWQENVVSTINLVSVMNSFNCNTLVFSSSATIYKSKDSELISEDAEIEAINPYGNTKLVNEKFFIDIFNSCSDNWKIINLRYFNPIGAHPSGLLGEAPKGEPNNIFPLLINTAAKEKKYLKVFGRDWPTADGTCIRDYIHVMDVAEGHIRALNYLENANPNVYNVNLGTGKGASVLDLISVFEKTNNVKVNYVFAGRREGDVSKVVANNFYAKKLLNWVPSRTLEEMCKDGWNWKLKNPNGF